MSIVLIIMYGLIGWIVCDVGTFFLGVLANKLLNFGSSWRDCWKVERLGNNTKEQSTMCLLGPIGLIIISYYFIKNILPNIETKEKYLLRKFEKSY